MMRDSLQIIRFKEQRTFAFLSKCPLIGRCLAFLIVWGCLTPLAIGRELEVRQVAKVTGCGGVAAKFSADGRRLLSVGNGGACVWEVATGKPLTDAIDYKPAERGEGANADLSPDGEFVVSAVGNEVRLYSVGEGRRVRVFRHSKEVDQKDSISPILNARFSSDGRSLVTAGKDGTARVWNLDSGKETFRATHLKPVTYAALSPDGGRLVASAYDTYIWDVRTGRLATPRPIRSFYREPSMSADWKHVLVRNVAIARVYDVTTVKELHSAMADNDGSVIDDAELNADGKRFVVVADGEADVWQTFNRDDYGRRLRGTGMRDSVVSASFSPNANLIVTCSVASVVESDGDSTAIWDVASGHSLARLPGGQNVKMAAFSADGKHLALSCVSSNNGDVDGYTLVFELKQ